MPFFVIKFAFLEEFKANAFILMADYGFNSFCFAYFSMFLNQTFKITQSGLKQILNLWKFFAQYGTVQFYMLLWKSKLQYLCCNFLMMASTVILWKGRFLWSFIFVFAKDGFLDGRNKNILCFSILFCFKCFSYSILVVFGPFSIFSILHIHLSLFLLIDLWGVETRFNALIYGLLC